MATQAERRAVTRGALLDAAVACLMENGVAGFTTADVGRRAELSNGALFRYFPTKADLLAATVERVFDRLRDEYAQAFQSLAPAQRTPTVLLELLWTVMSDPELAAIYDVYAAARTDAWMQSAIEPVARAHVESWMSMARTLVSEVSDASPEVIDMAVTLSILAMQGLVVNQMAIPDQIPGEQLVEWLAALGLGLGVTPMPDGAASGEPSPTPPSKQQPPKKKSSSPPRSS